jgi:hypothetical protein
LTSPMVSFSILYSILADLIPQRYDSNYKIGSVRTIKFR